MVSRAPSPATLEAVIFDWLVARLMVQLTVHLVMHLVAFIIVVAAVMGISGYSLRDLGRWVHRLRAEAQAASPVSAPAERPALSPKGIARSHRDLARKALEAGWQIQRRGSHDAWISPTGARVLVPSAPHGGPRPHFLAELRRAGLDFAA
jgi:hypothetical protein